MDNGNPTRHDNGRGQDAQDHLVITLNRETWHVAIAGQVQSDALALAMLRQAVDCYEAKIRQAYAVQFMQEQREAARLAQIAASVSGGRA